MLGRSSTTSPTFSTSFRTPSQHQPISSAIMPAFTRAQPGFTPSQGRDAVLGPHGAARGDLTELGCITSLDLIRLLHSLDFRQTSAEGCLSLKPVAVGKEQWLWGRRQQRIIGWGLRPYSGGCSGMEGCSWWEGVKPSQVWLSIQAALWHSAWIGLGSVVSFCECDGES